MEPLGNDIVNNIVRALVNLPLYVPVSGKRSFSVNLNEYRNANYHLLNKAKVVFKEMIDDQLGNLPVFETLKVEYILFPGSAREIDTNNICSIADKFFCDALVEKGKLPDDNFKFLTHTTMSYGHVDKKNPRVEARLLGTKKEEPPMQITLTQAEIETAIQMFVAHNVSIAPNQNFTIELRAGRGPEGFTATLDIKTTNHVSSPTKEDMLRTSLQQAGNTMDRMNDTALPKNPTQPAPQPLKAIATQEPHQPQDEAPGPLPDHDGDHKEDPDSDLQEEQTSVPEEPERVNLFSGFGGSSSKPTESDMPKGPEDPPPTKGKSLFSFN